MKNSEKRDKNRSFLRSVRNSWKKCEKRCAYDKLNVRGVIGDYVVAIDLDAQRFEPLLEQLGSRLAAVVGDYNAAVYNFCL